MAASSTLAAIFLLLLFCASLSSSAAHISRPLLRREEEVAEIDPLLSELNRQALGLADHDAVRLDASSSSPPLIADDSSSCEPPYGVLPCTDSLIGNLFLLAAYGYLLFVAARLLSEGSELLLTVLDAGIIGGLLLPILGSLPDSILIFVSGLGGTQAEAQEQVLVGIGLLAGSIVMLLTVLWGSCLLLGRCDLEVNPEDKLIAIDKTLTRPLDLTRTGVENDELTMLSARIMIVSILPFIVASLPMIFGFSSTGNIPVLVACVLAFAGLLAYCLYQVFTPWIQDRRKEIAQKMVLKGGAIQHLLRRSGNKSLIDEYGKLDEEIAKKLFDAIDRDSNNVLERKELEVMLTVTLVKGKDSQMPKMVNQIMKEYDIDNDNKLTRDEFLEGLRKWCKELKFEGQQHVVDQRLADARSYLDDIERIEEEEKEEEESENVPLTKSQIIRKAVLLLIAGTVLAAVFADPLVDAVNDFSTASNIPSFFISFVLLPLASNSSEAVSSILFASRKKKRNMSLTYSQIYGGVTMNCTMGLGIFLAVVYGRQLVWDFSSEVLVICLVVIIMGLLASFRKVFPTWMSSIALLLYPITLAIVAILDYVFGWE